MPRIRGRMSRKGFMSPAPPKDAPEEMKVFMAKTYAGLRSSKFPGESKENKMRASRITWYQTKREFPEFFRKHPARSGSRSRIGQRQPINNFRLERGTRQEMKEHPWADRKTARKIASDHIHESKQAYSNVDISQLRKEYVTGK